MTSRSRYKLSSSSYDRTYENRSRRKLSAEWENRPTRRVLDVGDVIMTSWRHVCLSTYDVITNTWLRDVTTVTAVHYNVVSVRHRDMHKLLYSCRPIALLPLPSAQRDVIAPWRQLSGGYFLYTTLYDVTARCELTGGVEPFCWIFTPAFSCNFVSVCQIVFHNKNAQNPAFFTWKFKPISPHTPTCSLWTLDPLLF